MNGNEFLDKMELIKPEYVEEADIKPKKQMANRIKWLQVLHLLFLQELSFCHKIIQYKILKLITIL